MKITTARLLATLATEGVEVPGTVGAHSLGLVRPVDRSLRNDGYRAHWLQAGFTYRAEHDGTGVRVTCSDWTGDWQGHTYRLAESQDAEYVDTLHTADGRRWQLLPGQAYELRETQPGGAWGLYEV